MKLYVEMDELEFKKYQESLKKPKKLTDFFSDELAVALVQVIQNEGGVVENTESYDPITYKFKKTSGARITKNNFVISLIIEKYGDG